MIILKFHIRTEKQADPILKNHPNPFLESPTSCPQLMHIWPIPPLKFTNKTSYLWTVDEAQLGEHLPSICKLLGLTPAAHKIGMVAYDINTLPSKYSFEVLSFYKLLRPKGLKMIQSKENHNYSISGRCDITLFINTSMQWEWSPGLFIWIPRICMQIAS